MPPPAMPAPPIKQPDPEETERCVEALREALRRLREVRKLPVYPF
jgi:hypothetical protein